MSRRASRTAIAGLLFSPLLAAPAWGAQTTLHCGDVITANTRLAADLTGCPVHGLVIGADGITLDLNGHTIAGDGVDSTGNPDVGALAEGHDRVTIRNGAVTGFDLSAFVDAADGAQVLGLRVRASSGSGILIRSSTHTRVEGNDAAGSGFSGIALLFGDHNLVAGNTATDNREGGLGDFGGTADRLEHNRASHNEFAGIVLDGSTGSAVIGNTVAHNPDDVVLVGDDNRVERNIVTDATGCDGGCGFGISVEGGSRNLVAGNAVSRTPAAGIRLDAYAPPVIANVLRSNLVRDAGTDGIAVGTDQVGPIDGTVVERNVAVGAADDGLDIQSPGTALTRNLALRNGDLGFEAVLGVVDAGDNRAAGNGNPAQCLNVVCGR